ncbi:cytochrome oxidase assembly protein 1 [Malassezia vespertilionis]|uniref:cytochrome oxidase assembly protein 1 n=1 Tax=Malassezia vespertilionis TaxID=2020962 RepID=UPI0024B05480|nr:cytochrome oxidase assembly protein 1 [Malassezia vespertilionis]WFD05311.1 cytochrome oxidase assembly protein 1 [Malassezia vespertilionis]
MRTPTMGTARAPLRVPQRAYSAQPGRWDPHVTKVKFPIPQLPNYKPYFILAGLSMAAFWYIFSAYLNNKERVGSSVLRMVSHRVKDAPEVHALLGEPVNLKRASFGDPWIEGIVRFNGVLR